MDSCFNYLREPDIFLPSCALIIAVLIFLTDLWFRFGESKKAIPTHISTGIFWCYIAILFASISFIGVVITSDIDKWEIGFFITSLLMGGLVISILILSSVFGTFSNSERKPNSLFTPKEFGEIFQTEENTYPRLMYLFVFIVSIGTLIANIFEKTLIGILVILVTFCIAIFASIIVRTLKLKHVTSFVVRKLRRIKTNKEE
ncbi:MAG: hypothetical protein A2158_08070 [Chloroflexi bacterium RBG_13_46_14]|nr:MAG: hypothetical protein A2158_08070 [Chloroflexi bacterium RBG_13_46_14]